MIGPDPFDRSRSAIRAAIDEAIAGGFIRCTRGGQANSSGQAAQSASYMLRWDTGRDYVKAPEAFAGFYAGEGHRSPIPNAFFDQPGIIHQPLGDRERPA